MNIIKKIIYALLALFGILGIFVIVCAFNPDITNAVAGFLYHDDPGKEQGITQQVIPDDVGIRNAADDDAENAAIAQGMTTDYIPPEQSELVIPDDVAGRNGYRQIQDQQEQVDDDTVKKLEQELDTGNTGDGLEFDPLYYPYYEMLNEKGKHLYRQIYANANDLYPVFAPIEEVTTGELRNIFMAVYNDHPELFWMETAYSGKAAANGRCVEIDLKFNRTAQNLESAKSAFDENADEILSEAQNLPQDYEKEKFVHDELIDRISYDLGAEMNQSAYSALVNDSTVCAGYARAFQYLMQQLGVPCYYCTGFAGENHAWNIIKLDDGFYNVDTTWDDTGSGTYDYFNKTDSDYASSHIRKELSVYLPPCNGQTYRNLEHEETAESEAQSESEEVLEIEIPSERERRAEIEMPSERERQSENETQSEAAPQPRSLEDVGFTQEQVITDIQDYYDDCYDQILRNKKGDYTFYNVIEGEELLEEWYRNYGNNTYRQAYMEDAMKEIGASSCELELQAEELQGGKFLIAHKVSLR